MKKIAILYSILIMAAFAAWAPNAWAWSDGLNGVLNCVGCHPIFNGAGSVGHQGHLGLEPIDDCNLCHVNIGDTPSIETCGQCHVIPGLPLHHNNEGVATCTPCHPTGFPVPGAESDLVPGYDLIGVVLDPCNGSEEQFESNTVSLDNDGDLLYDCEDPDCADNPDCAPPDCTVDADCDDEMFCNGAETCDTATGTCQAGSPPDCDDGVFCTVDTCDEANDECVSTPDDASCNDDDVCNGTETCDPVNGCQPGIPLNCDDENLCTTDSCDSLTGCANVPVECAPGEQCDPADGQCKVPPECTVDADCDDEMFCNGAETCDTATGTCQAGPPPDCDDGVVCTVDTCDEANDECVNTPDDASCNDDDVCSGTETCDPVNGCQPGTPLDCDDENLCTTDSCDSLTGCANVPVECAPGEQCDPADGQCKVPPECTVDADCDDEMFCNGAETCDTATGTCQAGPPPDCDDGVVCTVDTCDEANDECVNTPDDASCNDDDVCSGTETCDPVNGCQPGTPLDCDDENLCTTDSCDSLTGCANVPVECAPGEQCDPADGQCKVPPECTVDADCDDEMFCNGAETCDTATGTCQAGSPPDCDDGIDCTVDSCDEVNDACVNTPDDNDCPDDGLFCTGQEICDPFDGCVSTGDPCSQGFTCNEDTDSCDQADRKVTLCHKGKKTLRVGAPAVPAHLRHGDTLGACPQ